MTKCVPIVMKFTERVICFKVEIIDAIDGVDIIQNMDGGGIGCSGRKKGEASVIIKRYSVIELGEVVFFAGYLNNEFYNFSEAVQKEIKEACKNAAKAIWE